MARNIINEQDLSRLYLEEKKTDVEIAELYGCNKLTIYKTRKKYKISALKRWERNICEPTDQQLQIIYGSLLGDGSISNCRKGKYKCEGVFEVKHCQKQKDYVFWKHYELKNLCSCEPRQTNINQWRIRSFHHPFFTNLRSLWYPNGNKIVYKEHLNQIGPLGLAVWYLDDGTLSRLSNFIKIATCSFSEQDHDVLIQWLMDKFGIHSRMAVYSGYRELVIELGSRKQFIEIVKPFVVPFSMQYKVQLKGETL